MTDTKHDTVNIGDLWRLAEEQNQLQPQRPWRQSPQPEDDIWGEQEDPPSMIRERLWLGGLRAARDTKWMMDHNVTHVLSVLRQNVWPEDAPPCVQGHFQIRVDDFGEVIHDGKCSSFSEHIGDCLEFMAQALKVQTNVLYVHCAFGRNRSVTTVVAHLLLDDELDNNIDAALRLVRSRRSCADPLTWMLNEVRDYYRKDLDVILRYDAPSICRNNADDKNNTGNDEDDEQCVICEYENWNYCCPDVRLNNTHHVYIDGVCVNCFDTYDYRMVYEKLHKLELLDDRLFACDG